MYLESVVMAGKGTSSSLSPNVEPSRVPLGWPRIVKRLSRQVGGPSGGWVPRGSAKLYRTNLMGGGKRTGQI